MQAHDRTPHRPHGRCVLSQTPVDPDITVEMFFVDGPLPGFGAVEVIDQPASGGFAESI